MATILNDVELKRLIGAVIIDGDPTCIRPNAYVLRLGSFGEFLNTGKDFERHRRRNCCNGLERK
jgi:hypothetical protein